MKTLDLLLPGALLPARWLESPDLRAALDTPVARRLAPLRPADGAALPDDARALPHEHWLAARLGLPGADAWPGLAVTDAAAHWRVEPVHLDVGMRQVSMRALLSADLDDAETAALVAAARPTLDEAGWTLSLDAGGRWTLRAEPPMELAAGTPRAALGRDVAPFVPTGPDARRWRRVGTEIEMGWFGHPVNAAREATRRLPVNGLWLAGRVPDHVRDAGGLRAFHVPGSEAAASLEGWARRAGAGAPRSTESVGDPGDGDALAVDDALLVPRLAGDPSGWLTAWRAVQARTLLPALDALAAGRFDRLRLHLSGDTSMRSFAAARSDRWNPLRRLRPMSIARLLDDPDAREPDPVETPPPGMGSRDGDGDWDPFDLGPPGGPSPFRRPGR